MKKKLFFLLLALSMTAPAAKAGEPMLSIFKENYFTTGVPLNARPDWDTNDATFQISLRFNAAQNIKGKDWDLFFGYTQLSVWDVYKPSNPFRSHIFAPGLYLYHPFRKNSCGVVNDILFGLEHRSNGYASHESRDMNYAFATYTHSFGGCFTAQVTGRFGLASIGNDYSFELFDKYQGFVNCGLCFHTRDRRFMASASVTPLLHGDIPANVSAEIAVRPTARSDWFYLVARYHYGYDENQLDCAVDNVFLKHMVRVGVALQPSRLSHKLFF